MRLSLGYIDFSKIHHMKVCKNSFYCHAEVLEADSFWTPTCSSNVSLRGPQGDRVFRHTYSN